MGELTLAVFAGVPPLPSESLPEELPESESVKDEIFAL